MSHEFTIRVLEQSELVDTLPLIQLLNPDTAPETLVERMQIMIGQGYHCIGVFDGERVVGCCGFWLLIKYYNGKHLEPDNVIIHPDYRNHGLGEQMLNVIEQIASEAGCTGLEMNVYATNHAGQRFWMNQGYRILGYHMRKQIDKEGGLEMPKTA